MPDKSTPTWPPGSTALRPPASSASPAGRSTPRHGASAWASKEASTTPTQRSSRWGDEPPFRAPVFVVTSRPRQTLQRKGGTSFTYITAGIHSAIEQARTAANGKNVAIAGGGTLLRHVIKLGLLDELELHIVPVILGDGMRLLSPELGLDDKEGIELAPARVIATPDVTHIRYKVNGRSPLVLDNRGRDGEPAVA